MMASDALDPTKAGKLAQDIVAILVNEGSEMRRRAVNAAMTLLGETVPQQASDRQRPREGDEGDDAESADLATFFNREENLKPADHAQLCAAYHYSLYGPISFSITELKAIATDAGVILPDRVDMTLRNARHKGKKLFQPSGAGAFKPTAAGSLYFAEKWDVRPGKKTKTVVSNSDAEAQ